MNNNQIHENDATETIEFSKDRIKLTTEDTKDLCEWIMSHESGTYSGTPDDDISKRALLILLTAMCYADSSQREYMLFNAVRCVYQYSYSFDMEGEKFVEDGFRDFSAGKWNPQTEEAAPANEEEKPLDLSDMCKDFLGTNDAPEVSENKATEAANKQKTVSENQDFARAAVARWLSEQVSNPNKAVQKIVGDLLTELEFETESPQNSPEYIEMVLKKEAELSETKGEPTEQGENIVDALYNLATESKLSDEETSGNLVIVADQIMNPEKTELMDLAVQISDIMRNPLLPEKLYDIIGDEINKLSNVDTHSPENVLHNLELLQDSQSRN